ncbi:MAG: retropepsin-like aspartic protease, partial [Pseudomonadota bacterium]
MALHSSDGSENESWTTPIPDSRQNSHENSPHKRTPVARADLVFEPPLPPHIISRFHRMATAGRRSSSTLREQVEAAYDEVKRRLLPAHSLELPSTSHRALDPPESQVIHAIEDDRPLSATVSCTVNGQLNIDALTDTGSGYTLISEDLVEQLHLPDHIRQPFNGKVPKSVTGHPLTLIGTIDLSIRLGETEFSNHRTHILPCRKSELILGLDFLRKLGPFEHDVDGGSFSFRNQQIGLGNHLQSQVSLAQPEIFSLTSTRIPPRTEVVLPCGVVGGHEHTDYLFEPISSYFSELGLHAAPALVNVNA